MLPAEVMRVAVPALSASSGRARRPLLPPAFGGHAGSPAITGTNGKTTTAYLLAQALRRWRARAARISARSAHGRAATLAGAELTTPDAVALQRRLAELRDAGAATLAMEVSSHALDQDRVAGVRFDAAVFTNLTPRPPRLPRHAWRPTARPRRGCSAWPGLRCAVINVDDAFGRRAADDAAITPSGRLRSRPANELIAAPRRRLDPPSETAVAATGRVLHVETQLGRRHAALAAGRRLQRREPARGARRAARLARAAAAGAGRARARAAAPPGRMEAFGGGAQPARDRRLRAHARRAREACSTPRARMRRGRLIVRVRLRRRPRRRQAPADGRDRRASSPIASSLTSDNPRTEDPRAILERRSPAGMRGRGSAVRDRARPRARRSAARSSRRAAPATSS